MGLSLDGPQALHDAYRVDRAGRGSFERVQRAWELLQAFRVDTNILCSVHTANASHPLEVYRFIRDDLQTNFVQFIPIVEPLMPVSGISAPPTGAGSPEESAVPGAGIVTNRTVDPAVFGSFLIAVFDEWLRRDVGKVFVQTFDAALAAWSDLPSSLCLFQETCDQSLVLEHNGDLYTCDHFVDRSHRLGNILETHLSELVNSPYQRRFGLDKRDRLPSSCRDCDVLFACHGECPRNRFVPTSQAEMGLNFLCEGYRRFFHHIDGPMRRMVQLMRHGHAPAEIMRV